MLDVTITPIDYSMGVVNDIFDTATGDKTITKAIVDNVNFLSPFKPEIMEMSKSTYV